jgi:hypothetical protein
MDRMNKYNTTNLYSLVKSPVNNRFYMKTKYIFTDESSFEQFKNDLSHYSPNLINKASLCGYIECQFYSSMSGCNMFKLDCCNMRISTEFEMTSSRIHSYRLIGTSLFIISRVKQTVLESR